MKRPVPAIISALVMVCSLPSYGYALPDGSEELFFNANQSYRQGRFQEAMDGYSRLIRSGHKNGHLYFNLGNACFRNGKLGQAILNYERARFLIPRDPDLDFNLQYARDRTVDAVPESQSFINMTFFWLNILSLHEILWGFAVLNLLLWTVFLTRMFFRRDWTYYFSLVLVVCWLITGMSLGLKWYELTTDDRAVILGQEVDILAGPDVRDTILFKLHAGTIVHLERSEDEWSLVHLPDKKRGWVKSEAIEPIRASVFG